jgi:hypothetical protein
MRDLRSLMRRGGARVAAASLVALALATATASAQRGGPRGYGLPIMTPESYDGAYNFCRLVFRGVQGGDGGGWLTDYPDADLNLSTRLSELTKTPISVNPRTGEPNHVIVQITAPELSRCPILMAYEVGNFYIDDEEAAALRAYLLKGGFLWVDDFWGEYAWAIWEDQIRKVFPSGTHPITDVPLDHPIFNQVRLVPKIPQIPSINYWLGSGGDTSERRDSRQPHVREITDAQGRIMVLMTHNTDFGDSWEREGVDRGYFITFSVPGYAFGINVLVYAMTH